MNLEELRAWKGYDFDDAKIMVLFKHLLPRDPRLVIYRHYKKWRQAHRFFWEAVWHSKRVHFHHDAIIKSVGLCLEPDKLWFEVTCQKADSSLAREIDGAVDTYYYYDIPTSSDHYPHICKSAYGVGWSLQRTHGFRDPNARADECQTRKPSHTHQLRHFSKCRCRDKLEQLGLEFSLPKMISSVTI